MKRIAAAALTLGLCGTAAAEPPRFATFTLDNDFFAGTDKHYTNGMQVAFLADIKGAPQWIRSLSADPHAVIAVGQRMYTPANTDLADPDAGDRPYAGWAYLIGDVRTRAGPTVDQLTATVGVVGPASGARQTQNGFHHLLGEASSEGWATQVRNRPTLMAGFERAWPAIVQGSFESHSVDLSLRAAANVGTPFTYADAGAILRFGVHLPSDLPATHISLGPPRDGYRGTSQWGWYVWTGGNVRAVAYNSFLQGATFSGGPHVSREKFGDDLQVGAAIAWSSGRVGFTMVERSKEFQGQHGCDRFGQIAVSFAF